MSVNPVDDGLYPDDPLAKWGYVLQLDQPDVCAAELAQAAVDDPFRLISYVSIGAGCFGSAFGALVDLLAEHEPSLRLLMPAVATTMSLLAVDDCVVEHSESEHETFPLWLREIDKLECSSFMRRFDFADRSRSSYLIEARLADGQVATGRLMIRNGDAPVATGFATYGVSMREAARFLRDRDTGQEKRVYRHVKRETACVVMVGALQRALESDHLARCASTPTVWPLNLPVFLMMLQAAVSPDK